MKIEPTPITLGTSGLGRHSEPGSAEERAAVEVAIDLLTSRHGFVDTSNNYAAGRSEAVLGIALRELGMDGSRVISKVDQDPETGVFDRDRVLRSFEETTARLGVDRLPLLHLHDPYSVSFEDTISIGGAVQGLIELRSAGVVDAIGVAAAPVPLMAKYVETGVFDAVLIHNRFTLVDHSAETVFADAKARGMAVFNAAPFGSGLLVKGRIPVRSTPIGPPATSCWSGPSGCSGCVRSTGRRWLPQRCTTRCGPRWSIPRSSGCRDRIVVSSSTSWSRRRSRRGCGAPSTTWVRHLPRWTTAITPERCRCSAPRPAARERGAGDGVRSPDRRTTLRR